MSLFMFDVENVGISMANGNGKCGLFNDDNNSDIK